MFKVLPHLHIDIFIVILYNITINMKGSDSNVVQINKVY